MAPEPVVNRTSGDAGLADGFLELVESAPDAKVIVWGEGEHTGRIALVNTQAEHLFGYQRAELIGQPVEVLIPDRFGIHHSDHAPAI